MTTSPTTPPPPSSAPASMTQFPTFGDAASMGPKIFRERFSAVLIFFLIDAIAGALTFGPLFAWLIEAVGTIADSPDPDSSSALDSVNAPSGWVFIALVVGAFALSFVWLGIARFVLGCVDGIGADDGAWDQVKAAFSQAAPRFLPLLGWGIVLFVAVIAASAVFGLVVVLIVRILPEGGFGLLVFMLMGLIGFVAFIWASVKLAFFDYAILDKAGSPFARSAMVSSEGRFWPVFGILLVVFFVAGATTAVVSAIGDMSDSVFLMILSTLMYAALSAFMTIWTHGARAVLYRGAVPSAP